MLLVLLWFRVKGDRIRKVIRSGFAKRTLSIVKVLIATRSLSTDRFLSSHSFKKSYTKPGKHTETGISKIMAPGSLGSHTFLHRINTSGVKLDLY